MFYIKLLRKLKHFLCSIAFSENRAVYEIMSKNMVELEGPQMTSQYGVNEFHAG